MLWNYFRYFFWQDSNANEVDLLTKKGTDFYISEIKATETITTKLFEQLDKFEQIAAPAIVNKTLIYGGDNNQNRTNYAVRSWKNVL